MVGNTMGSCLPHSSERSARVPPKQIIGLHGGMALAPTRGGAEADVK
jgi:hypothetical protein